MRRIALHAHLLLPLVPIRAFRLSARPRRPRSLQRETACYWPTVTAHDAARLHTRRLGRLEGNRDQQQAESSRPPRPLGYARNLLQTLGNRARFWRGDQQIAGGSRLMEAPPHRTVRAALPYRPSTSDV
jgi:hypothetical protein